MDEEISKWLEENCTNQTIEWINGLQYCFGEMKDGWIAVFEVNNGDYHPKIQAKDRGHALTWCAMREPVTVPLEIIE